MKKAAAMMKKSVSGQAVKFTAASSKTNYANIIATWKSVSGAKYRVKLYRNGKLIATKNTSSLKYSFNGYKRGYKYTVEITPYATIDSKNYYGKIVSAAKEVPHKSPTISVKTSDKYKTIKAADRDSTGYQIYISKDKKFKKGVKKITVNTGEKALSKKITTNKNFKKGTNYVKVRAYTKYNNKTVYGTWSSAASVVYHTAPSITVKKSGKNRTITATDQDSTGYQIYISKNKNFNKGTQKIKVKTYSKALNKKLSTSKYFGKSKRYVKVRAYTNVKKNTVVYGPWSKIKTVR